MTDSKKAAPAIKPLVAMIALANAQMAFGCADVVVNAVSDAGDSPDFTTFEEALTETAFCGSITIDDALAGETLTWDTTNIWLDSSKALVIKGPTAGVVTVAADPARTIGVTENSTLELNDLRFVPSPDLAREVSMIRVYGSGSLTLDNTDFEGIDSSAWGGVLYNQGLATIGNSQFIDNSSTTGSGGAIYNEGHTIVRSGFFSGNRANGRGGAIESWDGDLTIEDTVFENNEALTDNDAGSIAGGAISTTGETGLTVTTISDSTFRGNQARNYGGAIYQSTGDRIEIQDTVFEDNHVIAASSEFGTGSLAQAHGGALAVDRSTDVLIQRSSFANNSATNFGGALYVGRSGRSGTVTVEDSSFDGNQAKISVGEATLARGGAIYADSPSGNPVSVSLVRSTLSGNSAEGSGGGLYGNGPDLTLAVVSSTLDGNTSAAGGGAMQFSGSTAATIAVRHSTITNNQITGESSVAAAVLTADNPAGVEISHTVIAGNTQANSSAGNICVTESSTQASLLYSFWNDTANYDTSCTSPVADTSNILDQADPGLSELADNGGYTLTRYPSADSPLRDAGNPNIESEPATDQRGSARIFNGVADIGAVEFGNQSPIASEIDGLEVTQGVPFSLDTSEAFSDPDGDQLSYAIDGEPNGAVIDATSGVISGSAQTAGDYTVTVTASDTYGASANTTFALKVAESSSGGGSGGGGSFGYVLGLLAPLAIWRRLRRKA